MWEVEAPAETRTPTDTHHTPDTTMSDLTNKKPTHGVEFIDGQPAVIFDTICTKDREPWLADDIVHEQLIETWHSADFWLVGRYIIMPDHILLFAWATENSIEYENWVIYWKSRFSKKHKKPEHRWQPNHWERRMRNAIAYEEKWNYTKLNAKRAGVVDDENDWPYQGVVFDLRWE